MTAFALSAADPATLKVDALVVGISLGRGKAIVVEQSAVPMKPAVVKKLSAAFAALGATGRCGEVVRIPGAGISVAPVVVAVGLGSAVASSGIPANGLRTAAGDAARALVGTKRIAFALPTEQPGDCGAIVEGALLGGYTFEQFRGAGTKERKASTSSVTVVVADPKAVEWREALNSAEIVANSVILVRDLVNTPSSHLNPEALADVVVAAAGEHAIEVNVLDEVQLVEGGFGGILAVGQGSANPPRLIQVSYRHPKATTHLALVGKGITFDSGGISIKPALNMHAMKIDMAGAASVFGAVIAIADLGLPINVTGWLPTAENMPSGAAQRPGDVITHYGGRTVEVIDTDAEGRLILADALVRAAEDKPDLLVDVATLTGAQTVALGVRTAGVMTNHQASSNAVLQAAERAGEPMWPMPMPVEIRATLDSQIADIANLGDRKGGMLAAAIFLNEFVPAGTKWVHIDIAGPAQNNSAPYGFTPKGATGLPVRTFVELARALSQG
ncbi:MAG: leucyl aminopeptidase [Actinomycetes bacterium]